MSIMSKGQRKDFLIEIRKSMSRYLSILFMVALGVAFFTGLRSSEPDMRESMDTYMDQVGYMDIRVISTLGLTDDDVMAIGAVRGVTDTEGVYTLDVLSDLGDSEKVIHIQSLTGEISEVQLSEGRLPRAADECVADKQLCENYGLALGDRITVYSGDGQELGDSLAGDTFIITGIGISPDFLTFERGASSIGTGSIEGFIAVDKSAFTAPAYTQVYVRADALDEYNCFSDEYADGVEELVQRIETIAGERCEIRFTELTDEPRQQIADAREELAEARAEAQKEFADAWEQILEGQEMLNDGWEELGESQRELDEGKADYEAGVKELNDSLAALEEGEQQIAEAKELLDRSEEELNAGRAALEAGWEQYNAGLAELEAAKAQLDEGEAALVLLEQSLAAEEAAYAEAVNLFDGRKAQLAADKAQLEADKAASDAAGIPWQSVPELVERDTRLAAQEQTLLEQELFVLQGLKTILDETAVQYESSKVQLEEGKAQYEAGMAQLNEVKAQLEASQAELNEGGGAIWVGREELAAREQELITGKEALADGQAALNSVQTTLQEGQQQLDDGRQELTDSEQELEESIEQYHEAKEEAEQQFAEAEAEIADAEEELAKIELPEWYVLDRNTMQHYVEYDLDAEKIGALANVFPVLFFFVAALVSLTTMTRMVEEQRTLIGTMKALGYSDRSIALKYILYALTATLFGSVLGIIVGTTLLPWIVITAYGIMYVNMPVTATPLQLDYALMATLMALASTVGATWMACHHTLLSHPSALMRPVAPAKGKRIFLERIPFLWKHLNFSTKSTLRNLFRYKKRLFMTLFGVGASAALLLVGFGIQDSLEIIVNRQYNTIWTYDLALYLEDAQDEEMMEELDDWLSGSGKVSGWLDVADLTMDAEANGAFKGINLMVPSGTEEFDRYVTLKNRTTDEVYALNDDTVLISEKLADKLSLSVGDTMTLKEDEANRYPVTVGGIVENYMNYYVYISPAMYEKTFGEPPEWTQRFLLYADGVMETEADEDELTGGLLELDGVMSTVTTTYMRSTIKTMLKALDYVVLLLIGAAGLLAFVVLYNLNNINITERKRELATIKLLGFYPGELAAYVYRENVILTILGIIAGLFMGKWLTLYVIETVEIDMIMFGRTIDPQSYVITALMTLLFAVIVNVVMYYRLQKIDMIESLKSVE